MGLVHNQILNKMSSMKLLPLLAVVIVLTTRAFACNYDRISRDPNYAEISKPKSTLSVIGPYGICVAPNGDIAVVTGTRKVQIYYSCGKMMKAVDLNKNGYYHGTDCTFMNNYLYVTDFKGRKVFKLSMTGELVKVFPGHQFMRVTSCKNELYFTKNTGGKNVVVCDGNVKELRSFSVPGNTRGIIVGIDGYLYVSIKGKQVYKYTKQGKQVGVTNYKNIQFANGLAMDTAGHLLIADHTGGNVVVTSPCGGLVKTIQVHSKQVPDVEIGNDGTVIVADYERNKVFLY